MTRKADAFQIRDTWRVLMEHRLLLVTCLAVSLIFAAAAKLYVTPLYRAEGSVIVDPRTSRITLGESIIDALPMTLETLASEVEVLRSRTLIWQVIDTLDLDQDPRVLDGLQGRAPEGGGRPAGGWLAGQIDALLQIAGLQPAPPDDPGGETADALRQRALVFKFVENNLSVDIVGASRVISIAFRSSSPDLSRDVANAFLDAYIENQVSTKLDTARRANVFLKRRIVALKREVENAEGRVADFKAGAQISDSGDVERKLERLDLLEERVTSLNLERTSLEHLRKALQSADLIPSVSMLANSGLNSPVLNALGDLLVSLQSELTSQQGRLGQAHPRIIELRQQVASTQQQVVDEVGNAIKAAELRIAQAAAQIADLESQQDAAQRSIDLVNFESLELRELEREAYAARSVLEDFLTRFKEIEQLEYDLPDSRILAYSELPLDPYFPKPALLYGLALVFGLCLGAGLSLLLDWLDRRYRDPGSLESDLGRPTVSVLPRLERSSLRFPFVQEETSNASLFHFREAHRAALVKLLSSDSQHRGDAGQKKTLSLMVTSAMASEGKTTFCRFMAHEAQQMGLKTLLVDCDLRGGNRRVPGISDLVHGDLPLERVVRTRGAGQFDYVSAGRLRVNPNQAIYSPKFRELMTGLRDRYSLIIFDTPPVLAFSESILLRDYVDMALLVVKARATSKDFVRLAAGRLQDAGVPLLGTVLNQKQLRASDRRNGPYYYTYRYGAVRGEEETGSLPVLHH